MRLTFSGAPEVEAPQGEVWPRITDPHFVARHGPGVESVEVLDERHFKVITGFGVGSIRLRFGIDVELTEINPPTGLTMRARGRAPGSAVEITAALLLEMIEPARTRLSWKADTNISGTVASVGARLMEGTARKLTEQFWTRFAQSIGAERPQMIEPPALPAPGPAVPPESPPAEPSDPTPPSA